MTAVTAAVLRSTGRGLSIETLEASEPRNGEVLLRMGAAGVCASDHHVIHGSAVIPLPCVLGHEGAEGHGAPPGSDPVRQISAYTLALGRATRCWVAGSMAIRPKRMDHPSAHSKLSIRDQW